jgi:hypothetical protein
MFASKLKRRVWPFQGSFPTSSMAGPLKANSDASGSDSGLKAANKVIKLTRVAPPLEEDGQSYGGIGCTTKSIVAKAADAGQRSAVRYEA